MGICGSTPPSSPPSSLPIPEQESSEGLPWHTSSSSIYSLILQNQFTIYSNLTSTPLKSRFESRNDAIVSNQRIIYDRLLGKQVFTLPYKSSSSSFNVSRILSNQNAIFEVLLTASTNLTLPHVVTNSEKIIARLYDHEQSPFLRVLWNQHVLYRLVLDRKSCHTDRAIDTPLSRKMRKEHEEEEEQYRKEEATKRKLFQQEMAARSPVRQLKDVTNNI